MSFSLNARNVDGVMILDLSGRLVAGEAVTRLREVMMSALNEHKRSFVLNMGNVSFIDSSGLGELVVSYSRVRRVDGRITMLNLTKTAQDLLQMTKLLTVFDTFNDEAAAVKAAGQ